jgi:transposase
MLTLVTILQYMEHLTDAQAADAVRSRVDWKYLLGLRLDDEGFDASVLSEFRTRLVAAGVVDLLLDRLLVQLAEQGTIRARGRARTDSTRVLAAVALLNQVELVGETMRHALDRLAVGAPDWLRAHSDPAWVERYGPRIAAARLPAKATEREALFLQIGRDGFALLAAVDAPDTPPQVQEEEAVLVLRQVWAQQYLPGDDGPRRRPGTAGDPAATLIRTPHDPEARWSVRRDTEWTGYGVHLTETCDADAPRLITAVETTAATTPDAQLLAAIHAQLARRRLLPGRHVVDAGYLTGTELVSSQRTHGVALVGPIAMDRSWQARAETGYEAAAFAVDWDAQQVTCPQGKRSGSWQAATEAGQAVIRVHFRASDCGPCPAKARCTRAGRRSLKLRPREEQQAIQAARERQRSAAFAQEYAVRAGIEGTISQAVRRCGLRRARYRGTAKIHLQHVLTAMALNLTRLAVWLSASPPRPPRHSPFTRLMAAATCP